MPADRFRIARRVYRKRVLIAIIYEDRLTGREIAFPA
jgi:hypothetical protein